LFGMHVHPFFLWFLLSYVAGQDVGPVNSTKNAPLCSFNVNGLLIAGFTKDECALYKILVGQRHDGPCYDEPPLDDQVGCSIQAALGKCAENSMKDKCNLSCGRCPGSVTAGGPLSQGAMIGIFFTLALTLSLLSVVLILVVQKRRHSAASEQP